MARSSRDIQLSEFREMISQLNTTIKTLNDTIARQQTENDNLKVELAWFRQKLLGFPSERRIQTETGFYKEKGISFEQICNRRLKDQKTVIEGFLEWLKQVNYGSV